MGLIICEYNFDIPDKNDPTIFLHEVDFYAWIPFNYHKEIPNHALSLRKRIKTQEYEVYRRFFQPIRYFDKKFNVMVITSRDLGMEQVIYKSKDLKEAVSFACGEWIRFHGNREPDTICDHEYGKGKNMSSFCGKNRH